MQAWFLDDGHLVGDLDDIVSAFRILQDEGPPLGLELSIAKCEMCGPRSEQVPECFDSVVKRQGGFECLGVPIGPTEFCQAHTAARFVKIDSLLEKLPTLNDTQSAMLLLRYSLSFCRAVFTMRTCPSDFIVMQLKALDDKVMSSLRNILDQGLSGSAITQAALPIRLGGLGLRSAEHHAPAAYIASLANTHSLVTSLCTLNNNDIAETHLDHAKTLLAGRVATLEGVDLRNPELKQRDLSELIDEHTFRTLCDGASIADKARLMAVSAPHAGAWLDARPTPELKRSNIAFTTMTVVWLGETFEIDATHKCSCCFKRDFDARAHHALLCDRGGDRSVRHDRMRDGLERIAQEAMVLPIREPPHLVSTSRKSRPADVLIRNLNGDQVAVDVTVWTPFAQEIQPLAATNRLAAAGAGEASKRSKWAHLTLKFTAFAIESTGGIGKEAQKLLDALFKRIADRHKRHKSVVAMHYYQVLSVALQRANANAILKRLPTQPFMQHT